jgi:hypothetical protein
MQPDLRVIIMIIRTTTDPISLHEVSDPLNHPCVYDGDGDNGIEIYFENEENRKTYLDMKMDNRIVLHGNSSDDYVAEG